MISFCFLCNLHLLPLPLSIGNCRLHQLRRVLTPNVLPLFHGQRSAGSSPCWSWRGFKLFCIIFVYSIHIITISLCTWLILFKLQNICWFIKTKLDVTTCCSQVLRSCSRFNEGFSANFSTVIHSNFSWPWQYPMLRDTCSFHEEESIFNNFCLNTNMESALPSTRLTNLNSQFVFQEHRSMPILTSHSLCSERNANLTLCPSTNIQRHRDHRCYIARTFGARTETAHCNDSTSACPPLMIFW